jgi:hypothetical protein
VDTALVAQIVIQEERFRKYPMGVLPVTRVIITQQITQIINNQDFQLPVPIAILLIQVGLLLITSNMMPFISLFIQEHTTGNGLNVMNVTQRIPILLSAVPTVMNTISPIQIMSIKR